MWNSNEKRLPAIDVFSDLRRRIRAGFFPVEPKGNEEWDGADVIITRHATPHLLQWLGDAPLVIDYDGIEPLSRRLVVTWHARPLAWLFEQLRETLGDRIDRANGRVFFGILAGQAILHLQDVGEDADPEPLLLSVLQRAERIAGDHPMEGEAAS